MLCQNFKERIENPPRGKVISSSLGRFSMQMYAVPEKCRFNLLRIVNYNVYYSTFVVDFGFSSCSNSLSAIIF